MYAAFRSHCLQDYGEYELLFGVERSRRSGARTDRASAAGISPRAVRVVACPESLGLNGKVSTLVQMLPHARYEHILINDSDIVAPPDYLRRVMSAFGGKHVGMVTSLYRGLAGKHLALEAGSPGTEHGLHGRRAGGARDGRRSALCAGSDHCDDEKCSARHRRTGSARRSSWRRLRTWSTNRCSGIQGRAGRCGGRDGASGLYVARILGAPDALGAQRAGPQARTIFRADCHVRISVGNSCGRGGAAGSGGRGRRWPLLPCFASLRRS